MPAPGAGPMWARLRYPAPSDGCDKREAMVSDVCAGNEEEVEARKNAKSDGHRECGVGTTVSVVWEDGSEEDGVPLSSLGPCAVEEPIVSILRPGEEDLCTRSTAVDDRDAVNTTSTSSSSSRVFDPLAAAADARERGNARFNQGDFAAAAAEYVEACAWLVSALPPSLNARILPGERKDWFIPDATANARAAKSGNGSNGGDRFNGDNVRSYAVGDANVSIPALSAAAASDALAAACWPTVGMRVRVLGTDGTSRPGMVSYVVRGGVTFVQF